ncbi:MerR family transcriptional regulator [Euzebya tangerina]|uniref:MerR family transcriptional regulator n=1 Tax=Euzebya tangerina TaxID=591198 RepID=UPI000E31D027|nr:MerR family transcriptional regulator [Euzebya tangerina]
MTLLVTIGEFSRMTRLSLKALRLYDERGLLQPAWVDPATGYRHYDPVQANRAEAVRILRSVDMPLDEIASVLEADDPDLVHKHLQVHRERLVTRLANDRRMLEYLESLMNRRDGVMPYTVETEEVSVRLVAATRIHTSLRNVGEDIGAGLGRLLPAMGSEGVESAGAPLVVYHDIIDEANDGTIEVCIPIGRALSADADVDCRELEGGPVATTTHRGRYAEIAPAYHTLSGWIAEHGHQVVGPPREIYLNDPQQVPEDELLTRVEFPIRPVGDEAM